MASIVAEIHRAFRAANVSDEIATDAAAAVPSIATVASKADIERLEMRLDVFKAEVKAEMAQINGALAALETRLTRQLWLPSAASPTRRARR